MLCTVRQETLGFLLNYNTLLRLNCQVLQGLKMLQNLKSLLCLFLNKPSRRSRGESGPDRGPQRPKAVRNPRRGPLSLRRARDETEGGTRERAAQHSIA